MLISHVGAPIREERGTFKNWQILFLSHAPIIDSGVEQSGGDQTWMLSCQALSLGKFPPSWHKASCLKSKPGHEHGQI